MADMISREAAVRALASSNGDYLDALERIEKIPAVDAVPVVMAGAELTDTELIEKIRKVPIVLKPNVDAVPVVRCKDCKYWYAEIGASTGWLPCQEIATDRDWYCASGKRRDSE